MSFCSQKLHAGRGQETIWEIPIYACCAGMSKENRAAGIKKQKILMVGVEPLYRQLKIKPGKSAKTLTLT